MPTPLFPHTISIRGGQPLNGTVELAGAKNMLSKAMVAASLSDEQSILDNVADLGEMRIVAEMLQTIDITVSRQGRRMIITPGSVRPFSNQDMARFGQKNRIPILFCGPMLHRFGRVALPDLGGDKIGARPVDFHIHALQKMGAELSIEDGVPVLSAKQLKGADIDLDYPSVMATEQILLTGSLAEGTTNVRNAAIEPEIMDLIDVLKKMGANITVQDTRRITIEGVSRLNGYTHKALPDRNEAASWACAALATNGRITVSQARYQDLEFFLDVVNAVGGAYAIDGESITFWRKADELLPVTLQTEVHPGFMTDWQQPLVVALTQASGTSVVHETVYEDRFGYTKALNAMGAAIELRTDCLGDNCRFANRDYLHSAIIAGPTKLHGSQLEVPDIRAGFSYVIAALLASGTSTISNMEIIGRGYENFTNKLADIGADFSVVES